MYGASVAAKGGTRILPLLGSTALPAGRDKVPHSLWKSHPSYLHEMLLRGSRGPLVFDVWLETAERDLLFASKHHALWHLETKLPLASVASENFGLIILQVVGFRTEIYVYFGKRGLLTPLANWETGDEKRETIRVLCLDWLNNQHWQDFLWGTLAEVLQSCWYQMVLSLELDWRKQGWCCLRTIGKIDFGQIFPSLLIHPWQYLLK